MLKLECNLFSLNPKEGGAEGSRDFRPICLVGGGGWMVKVLANRIRNLVGKVVSEVQGAFVEVDKS